ncbi:trihelix transcription factor ASR3 [Ricinus communis]|uniref:trihelix transcription factor ASR3 n=1 Tax=Ricinus communis TaxID=3988 RepID=UPI00201AB775|nr:trihelix transcription factor ASR3 [Ricinus communis]
MEGEISEIPKTAKRRGPKPKKSAEESSNANSYKAPSPPRTRSQVAPDWTTKESLILVNEIAAVEGDCLKALSTHQKWNIIVQNCSVLDVSRTLNQCRSKWSSLLADYNRIKQWDSKSSSESSYWLLDPPTRDRCGLPHNFDYELFRAIDHYVRAQKDHPDTDPDTDPEADADLLDVIAKLGSKRHRRRSMSLKIQPEETSQNCCTKEQAQILHAEEEPQQSRKEENLQMRYDKDQPQTVDRGEEPQDNLMEEQSQESCRFGNPEKSHVEEKPQESLVEEEPKNISMWKKKITGTEEKEQLIVEKLHGNAESIRGVVQGSLPEVVEFGAGDSKSRDSLVVEKSKIIRTRKKKTSGAEEMMMVEKLRANAELIHDIVQGNLPQSENCPTDVIRRQGDKLIACLGEIVNILNQFPYLVQECD